MFGFLGFFKKGVDKNGKQISGCQGLGRSRGQQGGGCDCKKEIGENPCGDVNVLYLDYI